MRLSDQQLRQYRDDGFLILPGFFTRDDLEPVMDWIDTLVDDLARRLLAAGKIRNQHAGEGFYTRLTRLEEEFPGAAVLIHIGGVLGQPLADLWASPRLLDVVEQLLGPEIAGHPVWNLRSKTPLNPLATVPWHQDTAYLAPGAEQTLQPTAWIPFLDARGENGTLQVLRGGHRSGEVFRHRPERTTGDARSWYLAIADEDLPEGEIVTCEMPMGSVLFINQLIPHRSTENYSDKIRWSVDLRWQRPDEPSGFERVKECILMRTARNPDFRVDWTAWARKNRIADAMDRRPRDEFDPTVTGPWLHRWEGDG
jgi:hypothetical protein